MLLRQLRLVFCLVKISFCSYQICLHKTAILFTQNRYTMQIFIYLSILYIIRKILPLLDTTTKTKTTRKMLIFIFDQKIFQVSKFSRFFSLSPCGLHNYLLKLSKLMYYYSLYRHLQCLSI